MWTWQYKNITSAATTTVAAGPCELMGVANTTEQVTPTLNVA